MTPLLSAGSLPKCCWLHWHAGNNCEALDRPHMWWKAVCVSVGLCTWSQGCGDPRLNGNQSAWPYHTKSKHPYMWHIVKWETNQHPRQTTDSLKAASYLNNVQYLYSPVILKLFWHPLAYQDTTITPPKCIDTTLTPSKCIVNFWLDFLDVSIACQMSISIFPIIIVI